MLTARVLDASGNAATGGRPLPRGRAVLDVTIDSVTGQRLDSDLAGLAGFTVWLDEAELVAVPTAVDGPGIGGEWRIAFDTGSGASGPHRSTCARTAPSTGCRSTSTYASYVLGP